MTTMKRCRDVDTTRAALLDAATREVAWRGYASATLDEIAARAGFTRGALHHHFATKESLFLAVVARRNEQLLDGYEPDAFTTVIPPDTTARAERWEELHRDDPIDVALRLELRARALRNPDVRRELLAVDDAAVDATAEKLAAAETHGRRLRLDPRQFAELLLVVSRAAAERAVLTETDSKDLLARWLDVVWRGAVDDTNEEE